ncbi:MAG: L-threonylcarbamoyladenylate synthase [Myxococcota bacterium]
MSVALEDAADWLAGGGLLAYPTETVWGLGADARSDAAVERLRRFKGRGDDAPISILVDDRDSLPALGFDPSPLACALADRYWPGPLTLVLPCAGGFAKGVARDDGAVGVRCSPHPAAAALAGRLAARGVGPVTATSLNRTGEPAARSRREARALCDDGDDAPRLLDVDDDAGQGRESTVLDLCASPPRVLRWGAIEEDDLNRALAGSPA